jgi:cytochrome P450 family 135
VNTGAANGTALPPGPRMPSAVQTYFLATQPLEFLERCWRRFGDSFTLNVSPMGTTVYLASPGAVKKVFTGDPKTYHAGAASHSNAVAKTGSEAGKVPRSLLILDEDAHLFDRKLMLPPFHGKNVDSYARLVQQIVASEVDTWPLERPFRIRARTQAMTLEVMLRVVFGMDQGSARLEKVRDRLPGLLAINPIFVWAPWLRRDLGSWSPEGRYRRLVEEVSELMIEEIRERRRSESLEERGDVLSMLLRATTEDGRPAFENDDHGLMWELATLLLAGHETTASALAWTFDQLLHHPDKLARLQDELERGEEEYLEAVVRETLRLRPVLIGASRKLTDPVEFDGWRIPAGVIVRVAIALVHLRPDLYPDPHAFRPERFLERKAETSYSWIPFGGGVRRCLGAPFAEMEMKIAIPEILRRVDLEPARRRMDRGGFRHMLLVPARGARVRVVGRKRWGAEPAPGDARPAEAAQCPFQHAAQSG